MTHGQIVELPMLVVGHGLCGEYLARRVVRAGGLEDVNGESLVVPPQLMTYGDVVVLVVSSVVFWVGHFCNRGGVEANV